MSEDRMLRLWAYQLLRHPLLAAHLETYSYEDVRFVSRSPGSSTEAIRQAENLFAYLASGEAILTTYLNGERTLSNKRLAMLIVTVPETPEDEYEIMLCATHFLGDGMALHTFMNEFYTLLGSSRTIADFELMIREELGSHCRLPPSLEERLPGSGTGLN